jgi:hypothetical protein
LDFLSRRLVLILALLTLALPVFAVPWAGTGLRPPMMRPMVSMKYLDAKDLGPNFDIRPHLKAGRFNVVDFYADW